MTKPTPEQIEAGMTRDEAMKVWLEACGVSQEAWFSVGEQPNDPEGDVQGRLSNEAAAAVIQQAFAERDGEMRAALENAEDTLRLAARVSIADPHIVVELRELCERVGYGNVMASASALWRSRDATLQGSEFVNGPCRTTVEASLKLVRQALAAKRGVTVGEQTDAK